MSKVITASIDVTKIDKSKLIKGEKGTYLNILLRETPDSDYGNSHMVVQSVSKEEREAGERGAILGNAKTFIFNSDTPQQQAPSQAPQQEEQDADLPF